MVNQGRGKVAEDSSFPFEDGEPVGIRMVKKTLVIEKLELGEHSES